MTDLAIHLAGTIPAALAGIAFGGVLNSSIDAWKAREGHRARPIVCRACGASFSSPRSVPRRGWLTLQCRCPACRENISLRYPLVVLCVAGSWAVAAWQVLPALYLPGWAPISIFDSVVFGLVKMILCWLLIGLAVLDVEDRWLPDWFTLGGAAIGALFTIGRFAVSWIWKTVTLPWSLESHFGSHRQHLYDVMLRWIVGIVVLPGIIYIARWSYQRIRNQEGTRVGEAKLMLLLAAWLGFSHALFAFALGVLLAFMVVLVRVLRTRSAMEWISRMPLASFLCAGGILSGLWGTTLIEAYLRWADFM